MPPGCARTLPRYGYRSDRAAEFRWVPWGCESHDCVKPWILRRHLTSHRGHTPTASSTQSTSYQLTTDRRLVPSRHPITNLGARSDDTTVGQSKRNRSRKRNGTPHSKEERSEAWLHRGGWSWRHPLLEREAGHGRSLLERGAERELRTQKRNGVRQNCTVAD